MTSQPTQSMVVSQKPNGAVLITLVDIDRLRREGDTDANILQLGRACSDAIATEIVSMTPDALAAFAGRHGGRVVTPFATYRTSMHR